MKICISRDSYLTKPNSETISDMRFDCLDVDVDYLIQSINQGKSFTSFMFNGHRNQDNFICSSLLVYDIDHSTICMNEYIEQLTILPTFAYNTPSDKDNDHRFRLCYVLSSEICSIGYYYTVSKSFAQQLKLRFVDEHSYEVEHYWNGSYNCNVFRYNTTISIDDIKINPALTRKNYKKNNLTNIESTSLVDFNNLSYTAFLEKYKSTFNIIEHSNIEINEDEPIITFNEDYFEIIRPFNLKNGDTFKLGDGNNRRKRLYLNSIIRRKIKPTITFDELLYNVVYDFINYFINNGNRIDKKTLYEITANSFKAEIDNNTNLGKPKHKFKVNSIYCAKHGLTAKQVLGLVRNKKQFIGELYDPSLTNTENLKVMAEYGLNVGISTLTRWKRENNISG